MRSAEEESERMAEVIRQKAEKVPNICDEKIKKKRMFGAFFAAPFTWWPP
jgi:hypothetical protein